MTQCSILDHEKDKEFVARPISCVLLKLQGDAYKVKNYIAQSPSWLICMGNVPPLKHLFQEKA